MKKSIFYLLSILFIMSSCNRFTRTEVSTDSSTDPANVDPNRTDTLDTTKYNTRFYHKDYSNFVNDNRARRSIANFFFYNQRRYVAAAMTTNDTIQQKQISSNRKEAILWCDFKNSSDYNTLKNDYLNGFYRIERTNYTVYSWNSWCDTTFANYQGFSKRDRDNCKDVYSNQRTFSDALLALRTSQTDLYDAIKDKYQFNENYIGISADGTVSLTNKHLVSPKDNFNVYDIDDSDMCYNSGEDDDVKLINNNGVITEVRDVDDVEDTYWNFWELYNASSRKDAYYASLAPIDTGSINKIEIEFGFNIDSNREILEDKGSYLKLNFKTENKDFQAIFAYSRDNLELRNVAGGCDNGLYECKTLSVEFEDNCGVVNFSGILVYKDNAVVLRGPQVSYVNFSSGYRNYSCQMGTATTSISIPDSDPRGLLANSTPLLFEFTDPTHIEMEEIK